MTDTPMEKAAVHEGTVLPPGDDDAERLRAEIERTREHLGQTVEQLAARLDVKSRARAKGAELAGQATAMARNLPVQVRKQGERARDRAVARAGSTRGILTGKAAGPGGEAATAALPAPARKAADTARKYPVPLSAAAAFLAALALIIWRLRGNHENHGNRGKR